MFPNSCTWSEPTGEHGIMDCNGIKGCSAGSYNINSCTVLQIFFYKFLLIFTGEQAFSSQEPQGQNIPFCTENLSCHLDPMEILASVSTSKRSLKVDVKGWSLRVCARREKVKLLYCMFKKIHGQHSKKNHNTFFLSGGGRWGWFFFLMGRLNF